MDQTSYLYHFSPFDEGPSGERVARLILNHELSLPAVAALDDPFDSLAFARFEPTEDGLRRIVRDLVEQMNPGLEPARKAMEVAKMMKLGYEGNAELVKALFQRFTTDVRQQVGMARFSATAEHPLLWQQWAGGHTGVSLVFARKGAFERTRPVQYDDSRPAIPCHGGFTGEESLHACLSKGTPWAHEQEWRLVRLAAQGGPGAQAFEPDCLYGAILGAAMTPARRRAFQALVAQKPYPIKLWRANLEPSGFGLEMVPQN